MALNNDQRYTYGKVIRSASIEQKIATQSAKFVQGNKGIASADIKNVERLYFGINEFAQTFNENSGGKLVPPTDNAIKAYARVQVTKSRGNGVTLVPKMGLGIPTSYVKHARPMLFSIAGDQD